MKLTYIGSQEDVPHRCTQRHLCGTKGNRYSDEKSAHILLTFFSNDPTRIITVVDANFETLYRFYVSGDAEFRGSIIK